MPEPERYELVITASGVVTDSTAPDEDETEAPR